ncbi:hypothetical protein C7999DRAFT_18378 [Corynascus novoguineensis]|uniref:Secreted protein n=1 Tax=Corynascus novoguineensis TaxID=1126955 RepID=A0AAN7CJH9_9PEZI|nr:hypothetical protein C7999DRAFT_18378 [Corynascus novoguineensis]
MKVSTLLVAAVSYLGLASAAAIANPDGDDVLEARNIEPRRCFKSGANFANQRANARDAAAKACKGPLKGKYYKRETRVRCYGIGGGKHVKLTVGLTGSNAPGERTLGYSECYDGLLSEIMNCGKGGDTTYGRWRFRADPNEGSC